jgi:hypothetical protein
MKMPVILEHIRDEQCLLTFVQYGGLVVIYVYPVDRNVSNVLGYVG